MQGWLAEHLSMRSAANVSQRLRRASAGRIDRKLPKRLETLVPRACAKIAMPVKICTLTRTLTPNSCFLTPKFQFPQLLRVSKVQNPRDHDSLW